jgi:polyphosphate kinase 2 (PPK2 family)
MTAPIADTFGPVDIPENSPQARFEQASYPYKDKMKKAKLQVELLKVQRWVEDTNQKIVILFEGRDAAGKGGTI